MKSTLPQKHRDMQQHISDFLFRYRKYKSLNREDVANDAESYTNLIYKLEKGQTFTFDLVCRLCDVYGLMLTTLFNFAETAAEVGRAEAYKIEAPYLMSEQEASFQETECQSTKQSKS